MKECIFIENVSLSDIEALLSKVMDEKLKSITPQPAPIEAEKLLTRSETAKLLKISLPTLDGWTKTGVIKAKRIGTRIRYVYSDIQLAMIDLPNIKYQRNKYNT